MRAPLARLYGWDATVIVCFAIVCFHFPAHPQSAAPAHTGQRAWGCSGPVHLKSTGQSQRGPRVFQTSRTTDREPGWARPLWAPQRQGWGCRLSSGRGREGTSPDGPWTEGREGLPSQACPQPPLVSGWSVRAEEGSVVLSQLGASDDC